MLVRVAIFFPSQLVRSMASGQTGQTGLPVESHVEEAKWLAQGVATILLPRGVERNVQERIRKLHLTVNLLARVSHYVVYNVITQISRQNFFFSKSSIGLFTEKKPLRKINWINTGSQFRQFSFTFSSMRTYILSYVHPLQSIAILCDEFSTYSYL